MTDDEIFRRGSKTYYFASQLFPRNKRSDVAKLYSFVRVADDYVDQVPQNAAKFHELVAAWHGAETGDATIQQVVTNMNEVAQKYTFDPAWVAAFLHSMELDLTVRHYDTAEQLQEYIYGSAEVIGLMMARVLGLPSRLDAGARAQGTAMQLINFLRDVSEDITLGRQYIPQQDVKLSGLETLSEPEARRHPDAFARLVGVQLERYRAWQKVAEEALSDVPARYRIPVQVANDGYTWTASKIAQDPLSVFEVRHKPSRRMLVGFAAKRTVGL